jgi:hypothetical protein
VGRARFAIALLVALSLSGAPPPAGSGARAEAMPLRMVVAGGVTAYVPPGWEVRPIDQTDSPLVGIQASRDLERWERGHGGVRGVEAYWVDATEISLPSEYYILAARGPAMESLPHEGCRSDRHVFVDSENRSKGLPDGYLATASGTCVTAAGGTRWAAFVAAPGYGPMREIGIPQSGMYFALASVPQGPGDERMLLRMLGAVSFGQTRVDEFVDIARTRMI